MSVTKHEQNLIEREERLKRELAQTRAALQKREAQRKARERKIERALETKRKILVGAAVLNKFSAEQIKQLMNECLTRDDDRALFDLSPVVDEQAHTPQPPVSYGGHIDSAVPSGLPASHSYE